MKRATASPRFASTPALARQMRTVWSARALISLPRAMILILPSSTSSSPNGAAPRPMSIWPVMAIVRVAGWPPVETGRASTLYWSRSASSAAWLDEPFWE